MLGQFSTASARLFLSNVASVKGRLTASAERPFGAASFILWTSAGARAGRPQGTSHMCSGKRCLGRNGRAHLGHSNRSALWAIIGPNPGPGTRRPAHVRSDVQITPEPCNL